jgi:hypothetical protein
MAFGKSISVDAFKASNNINVLKVLKNPSNNKLFMSGDGITVGAVSTKCDLKKDLLIVDIIDDDTAQVIPCLYNPSEGAEVMAVL